jgi:hypothetical protein
MNDTTRCHVCGQAVAVDKDGLIHAHDAPGATTSTNPKMATDAKQETQTWWRADTLGAPRIEPLEVVRVTTSTVSYLERGEKRPRRANRVTNWDRWFPSEAQAVAFQRERLRAAVKRLRATLVHAESTLAAFNEAHPLPATGETSQ